MTVLMMGAIWYLGGFALSFIFHRRFLRKLDAMFPALPPLELDRGFWLMCSFTATLGPLVPMLDVMWWILH